MTTINLVMVFPPPPSPLIRLTVREEQIKLLYIYLALFPYTPTSFAFTFCRPSATLLFNFYALPPPPAGFKGLHDISREKKATNVFSSSVFSVNDGFSSVFPIAWPCVLPWTMGVISDVKWKGIKIIAILKRRR